MERGLEYPPRQVDTALAASASRLGLVANRARDTRRIWHSYGIIKRFIPEEVQAMQKARQAPQAAGPQFGANGASAYLRALAYAWNGAGDSLRCKQCSRALIGQRVS
jgi:hypothetical protein